MGLRKDSRIVITKRFAWDEVDPKFKKGSHYTVVDSPNHWDIIGKEAIVVAEPRQNQNSVSVETEGRRFRLPTSWLRAVIEGPNRKSGSC